MHKIYFNGTSLSECCFTRCFLPEYTQMLEESQGPCSRLAHARNMVVCGGARAFTSNAPNIHQPRLYHTNEALTNLPCLQSVLQPTTQTSSKIVIRSTLSVERMNPKLQLRPRHLFCNVPCLWVVLDRPRKAPKTCPQLKDKSGATKYMTHPEIKLHVYTCPNETLLADMHLRMI